MAETGSGFDVQPSVGNHFAWIRTLLGLQRTLMAAVRTAVSLIGFGFTVAQFFQRLQGNAPEGLQMMNPETPRNLGLVLITAGVLSLAIFTWQYRHATQYLRSGDLGILAGDNPPMHTSCYMIAFAVMLIGLMAFGSVFLKF